METSSIPLHILKKLPIGRPLCIEELHNTYDKKMAIKWNWLDYSHGFAMERTAYFSLDTGTYLEEAL